MLWLALPFAVAFFGSRFMPGEWYLSLSKPSWTPPGWIFGPVWTILYAMMGVAAWLVWRKAGISGARFALGIFIVQLVFNGLWSWLFFGLKMPGLAAMDILLLWASIFITMIVFWKHAQSAGLLFVPYLAWVSFATALNIAIWWMNRRA